MKLTVILCFFLLFANIVAAQIKVDSNYTVFAMGIDDKLEIFHYILRDLNRLHLKENSSGKICKPLSMHFTFIIQSEIFYTNNISKAQTFLPRMKPLDTIIIDNIVLPSNCFRPPKQIVMAIN